MAPRPGLEPGTAANYADAQRAAEKTTGSKPADLSTPITETGTEPPHVEQTNTTPNIARSSAAKGKRCVNSPLS